LGADCTTPSLSPPSRGREARDRASITHSHRRLLPPPPPPLAAPPPPPPGGGHPEARPRPRPRAPATIHPPPRGPRPAAYRRLPRHRRLGMNQPCRLELRPERYRNLLLQVPDVAGHFLRLRPAGDHRDHGRMRQGELLGGGLQRDTVVGADGLDTADFVLHF